MPVQLLQYTDPVTYAFDHAMDHRPWIGVWADVRPGYSVIPYWIESPDMPEWRNDHLQAHLDTFTGPPNPIGPFNPPVGILGMTGPDDSEDAAAWWIFTNWMQHYLVAQNIAQNQWTLYYPFW